MNKPVLPASQSDDIAIVGMSVNVPGAANVDTYWQNLRDGVESIRHLSEQDLLDAGESPEMLARKNYVAASADLKDFDHFDAEFFGFSPKDAAVLDPQHRKFLEVAWEAMEQAGHPPESMDGDIGVYAGCGMGSYFYFNICSNPDLVDDVGMFLLRHTGNDKDFLSTRASHVFDLKGPSVNLQTACSTSLVAIHYACQALRAGEVSMALAGGVTIELPQGRGYEFKENEILSPDGHCHAFDHRAQGTVFGSGAGAVALRRLSDAIADGDHIWGVIKGSAVNNDGAAKAGYLAPSVDGQTAAITQALDAAGVAAQSIGMVECHGTGTYLGDPIEVAALTEAYRTQTDAEDFCRIGSVKTNIGHLDTAAGVAGFVKSTLALHNQQIPPSLGYEAPNPAIPFEGSPFRVNDSLYDWPKGETPRRAAINALGVGGTNAHAIIEEAPARAASDVSDWPFQILCVSGHSKAALDANATALADHLRKHPEQPLADIAFTLKEGRRGFDKRRVVVAQTHAEAADLLGAGNSRRVFSHDLLGDNPEVVFMFPGGGAQYAGMARDLYETEPVFATWMDRGLAHLEPQLDYDIRAIWLPDADTLDQSNARLKTPSVQLPLIAITEYALAQLWMSWGVQPAAMVGHSMGENVAACLAGVMSFENLVDLVLLRGRLFDEVPAGGMLSISAPLSAIEPLLGDDLDIASVNAPELIAVSGPQAALDDMQTRLDTAGLECQRIAIDIAAHSRMLEPILDRYRAFLARLDLQAPKMPFVSNRSGQTITDAEATSPDYWVGQLRNSVNFADCITTLAAPRKRVFLEVGPGKALCSLAQMNEEVSPMQVISSLRHPEQEIGDDLYFMTMIGRLWACGVNADWSQIWGTARRNRVVLPTYQFQRSKYFISPGTAQVAPAAPALVRHEDMVDWGAVPTWQAQFAAVDVDAIDDLALNPQNWLIFADDAGLAVPIIETLKAAGHCVAVAHAGDAFADLGDGAFVLAPEQGRAGYDNLLEKLKNAGQAPDRIAHFWLTDDTAKPRPGSSIFDRNLEHGFWSLTWLAQSLAEADLGTDVHICAFSSGATQVQNEGLPHPEKALIAGPVGVVTREVPGVTCAQIDIENDQPSVAKNPSWFRKAAESAASKATPTDAMLEDMLATPANVIAAHRDGKRFEMRYKTVPFDHSETPAFRDGGTYLITGGFGGIGQTLAADILRENKAHVVLLSRGAMPTRDGWQSYINRHGTADRLARRMVAVMRLEEIAQNTGGSIEVVSADVANLAQMRRVIEGLQSRFGALTGVIHAAGVLDDAPLLAKSDAAIDAVLSPKVQGLRILDQLLPDGALELLVLFSSTSTATRAAGQVDYVAANAWLNAFAAQRRNAKTRVVSINWGIWADVGMAASALPGGTRDILPARKIDAGILQTSGADGTGAPCFNAQVSDADWVLDQHRTKDGSAVMPGTGYIEVLAEAANAQGFRSGFEISDLYFLRAMPVKDGQLRDIRLTLKAESTGFTAELRSDCVFAGKPGWQLHAQALLSKVNSAAKPIDLKSILARCNVSEVAEMGAPIAARQEVHLNFGPQWQVLRETHIGDAEGVARLSLAPDLRDTPAQGHILHAGLFDIATGWAMDLVPGYDASHLWVPVSYGKITVHDALPGEIQSWVRLSETQQDDGFASFDVTIAAPDGRVLVEVEQFAMKRLQDGFGAPALDASEVTFDQSDEDEALTPAEERLAYLVSQGIRAEEGPEALRRAVALNRPQIMVSSMPLQDLIAQADQPAVDASKGQSFERPDLDGSYVAPENSTQTRLSEIWEALLGVSPVGIHDSFFDLGGHSLIAVRLFAQVKREFKVEFPISVLFEAPTIEKCAALIAAETGDLGEIETEGSIAPAAPAKFDYLVPLNHSDVQDAAPLFIVAGMFGNVLNLRHLALPFSSDRRVFGLQARGLIGDVDPHRDVKEAAEAYIAEMRQVQPEGPYLLSGYSGGGITAYEMAQQLTAQGQEVAVLAMLDTPLPVRPSLTTYDKALIKLAELRKKGLWYFAEWLRNRYAWEMQKRMGQPVETAQTAGAEFNNTKIEQAFMEAMHKYQTPDWDGPLTLFRPAPEPVWTVSGARGVTIDREYIYPDNDWTRFAPQIDVIEVPGDHTSMVLSPNVTVLAQELREIIARTLDDGDDHWQPATAAE